MLCVFGVVLCGFSLQFSTSFSSVNLHRFNLLPTRTFSSTFLLHTITVSLCCRRVEQEKFGISWIEWFLVNKEYSHFDFPSSETFVCFKPTITDLKTSAIYKQCNLSVVYFIGKSKSHFICDFISICWFFCCTNILIYFCWKHQEFLFFVENIDCDFKPQTKRTLEGFMLFFHWNSAIMILTTGGRFCLLALSLTTLSILLFFIFIIIVKFIKS